MIVLMLIVIAALAFLIIRLVGNTSKPTNGTQEVQVQNTPIAVEVTQVETDDTLNTQGDTSSGDASSGDASANGTASDTVTASDAASLAAALDDEGSDVSDLAGGYQITVTDLSVNESLPDTWLNILLLGSDERTVNEPARTDTMIICSINRDTGEVKLTSIMRDTAIEITEAGEFNGTYRINAANFFGGPEYAMKVVNEYLDMNIQNYVMVNFFGFQKIAEALGGIDVDITEAEMNEINKKAVDQAWIGYHAGVDESDQVNEYLTTYGANTHLNGRQTLAYARVRAIDSDFARTERQRTVIKKLTDKLRGKSLTEITALAASLSSNVSTNMDLSTIVEIAYKVLSSDTTGMDTLRLPENGTYTEEVRNEKAMFYEVDWTTNALELYNFIYE